MKLSSAYLYDELKKQFELPDAAGLSEQEHYQRPFLKEGVSGHVCVNPATACPDMLCIACNCPGKGEAWIRVAEEPVKVLNAIQQIFDREEELAAGQEAGVSVTLKAEGNIQLEPIFRRILTDRTADYVEISRQLSIAGWAVSHNYLCLVLQITYLDRKQLPVRSLCRHLKKQFADSVSFLYQDEVVTFFNLTRLQMSEEQVSSRLVYFIRDTYLKAGYSRLMHGHMNLRRQYVQARLALDVGSRKNPYLWIHQFNQVALPYILEQSTRRLPAYMICHEGVQRLKNADEYGNSDYLQTLKVYLKDHLNATQAARDLFIHRSTFLYRLERIKELLASELEDDDELLYIALSLRLLEQE